MCSWQEHFDKGECSYHLHPNVSKTIQWDFDFRGNVPANSTRLSQRQYFFLSTSDQSGDSKQSYPTRLSPRQSSGVWEEHSLVSSEFHTIINCLRNIIFSSELLTNQETVSKVQRKKSHAIVSKTILQIGTDSA